MNAKVRAWARIRSRSGRIGLVIWLCAVATHATAAEAQPPPRRFSVGIELPTLVPYPASLRKALGDLGIDYVNYYVKPSGGVPDAEAERVNEAMLALVKELGLDFSLACYVVDPPDSCLQAAKRSGGERFRGVVFDELAHCRLVNLTMHPGADVLADPKEFRTFESAYAGALDGFRALRRRMEAHGADPVATHVFPFLLHVAARAGFTPCPKICKELYSPVSLAIGLGAALQYDRPLWVDVDMWYWDLVPGHPAEEVESNLKLAYWLGADRVYLEGAGHNLTHPGAQGPPFSLVNPVTDKLYQLTPHGEMLRRFCREYVPGHPRPWTFRDVRPEIAIVRFPDGCHGQRYSLFPDALYGSPHLKSSADTEAWLGLWDVLTHGATGRDGITYFKQTVTGYGYQRGVGGDEVLSLHSRPLQAEQHTFFAPLNGVVVFDHTVAYERLAGIPLLFATGVSLSEETWRALERRADEGATVVVWGPLAARRGEKWRPEEGVVAKPRGKGKWVLTPDFGHADLREHIRMHLGHPDEIRYRFGERTVRLRRLTPNTVDVQVALP